MSGSGLRYSAAYKGQTLSTGISSMAAFASTFVASAVTTSFASAVKFNSNFKLPVSASFSSSFNITSGDTATGFLLPGHFISSVGFASNFSLYVPGTQFESGMSFRGSFTMTGSDLASGRYRR